VPLDCSRIEHDLSEHGTLFHVLVGRAGFAEWEWSVNNGFQSSAENMFQNFVQLAQGSHVRTEDRQLAREEETQIKADLRASSCAAGHERSGRLERAKAFVPSGRADVLEDNVDPLFAGDLANFF